MTLHTTRSRIYSNLSRLVCAACVTVCTLLPLAQADTLDQIKARGKLVVGVKKDVLLWGFLDPQTGQIQGLEPDLAKDLATRLGVELELVGLLTAERIAAVEQRQVDVLIATLSDTPERRERMTLVEPHYYSSGVNILARKSEGFKTWSDLRNRRVCGRRGAFYNRPITVQYGADIVALYGNELPKEALRDGRCSAFLYDDTAVLALLTDAAWSNQYEMPLPTLNPTPWSVALHSSEKNGRLAQQVSGAIVDWHRSGLLKRLESKWAIPQSAFVTTMNQLWSRRTGEHWYCSGQVDTQTPKECR